ncbi:putative LRR receptor-like serine/threonine-protein kinase isoform G [Glycine soja]|uniref:Putative LRR receptor-like serine/threonine-protein kinase isoform F n=1 Tax=Glycine soja TaxID=3848 RepID=A0A445IVX0_GLYSO|nr:putative LRR receptor-like serine/threonine-protein kinase isoform F [Glycine soja]RZB90303.1 putative LRR receptor-like serine/threonine-protein kinase isoform G [Glycine soja]
MVASHLSFGLPSPWPHSLNTSPLFSHQLHLLSCTAFVKFFYFLLKDSESLGGCLVRTLVVLKNPSLGFCCK